MAHQFYRINTGDLEREKYCQVSRYNGQQRLPASWWSPMGPTPSLHRAGYEGMCRGIHGTDGQQFHPGLSQGEQLWLFSPDLCRYSSQSSVLHCNLSHPTFHHQEFPPRVFPRCERERHHDVPLRGAGVGVLSGQHQQPVLLPQRKFWSD